MVFVYCYTLQPHLLFKYNNGKKTDNIFKFFDDLGNNKMADI